MGRRKKPGFMKMKMLASRVEEADYYKFEDLLKKSGKNLQEAVNLFVINYISGNIQFSGSVIISGENDE